MKSWPNNGEPVQFDKIIPPLRKAILFAYKIKRKNEDKSIPWKGLDIGERDKVVCLSPEEQFLLKNLKWSKSEHGHDALDEILALAVRLGIEQGRRLTTNKSVQLTRRLRDNSILIN